MDAKVLLLRIWNTVVGSLWFVPAVMVAAAGVLAWALPRWDWRHDTSYGLVYGGGSEGARALLTTIAGSMVTVAGVVFSITVVALTVAANQFGPHLLRNFVRDRTTQTALGAFIATFVYCVMVLRHVRGGSEEHVPAVAVSASVFFAVASLGLLIYFIHHVAEEIQADRIVAKVGCDLEKTLREEYPDNTETTASRADLAAGQGFPGESEFDSRAAAIAAERTGYIEVFNMKRLLEIAAESRLYMRLRHRAGEFVIAGCTLLEVSPAGALSKRVVRDIHRAFVISDKRTIVNDVEYAVNQLVQVAERALSTGINDPFTAIACVDRLGAGLMLYLETARPWPYHAAPDGEARIVTRPVTFEGITGAAFDIIRQSAAKSVPVSIRLLEVIAELMPKAEGEDDRRVLMRHATMVRNAAAANVTEPSDRADLERRYAAVTVLFEARHEERKS